MKKMGISRKEIHLVPLLPQWAKRRCVEQRLNAPIDTNNLKNLANLLERRLIPK